MQWLDEIAERIVARQTILYAMRHECRKCGSNQIQLMSSEQPAWWRCRICKLSFIEEPGGGPVILPDRSRVVNGHAYTVRRDQEAERRAFYDLIRSRLAPLEEIQARVLISRIRDLMPKAIDRDMSYGTFKTKKGRRILIPHNYLPPRLHRMWSKGEFTGLEAYAASMYVYGVRMNFIEFDVGTNFPQHEKVDISVRARSSPGHSMVVAPVSDSIKRVLDHCLIAEAPLVEVPGVTAKSKRQKHNQGTMLLHRALREFAKTLDSLAVA